MVEGRLKVEPAREKTPEGKEVESSLVVILILEHNCGHRGGGDQVC